MQTVLLLLLLFAYVSAWPIRRKKIETAEIGPTCTVGAHNWLPKYGPCPPKHIQTEEQLRSSCPFANDAATIGSSAEVMHKWPDTFMTNWDFYFINNASYAPPYNPLPLHSFTITKGQTYYDAHFKGGSMRETYESKCIPIFVEGPFSKTNNFSCDFINVAETQKSYLITHNDRPPGTPPCCIIGEPFHPPPPDFARNLTIRWSETIAGVPVDWNAVDVPDAGGFFNYGFVHESKPAHEWSLPYVFYMKGAPQIATWMYQVFYSFQPTTPPTSIFDIPYSCAEATVCPGWS